MANQPDPHRILAAGETSAVEGRVRWSPAKSFWIGSMTVAAVALGPVFFSWSALGVFLTTSAVSLCFGHSVGMHRRLIHGSFECPLWLERLCVYLGVLVGMAGPVGMIRQHDMRDWAQRQPACHPYLRHGYSFWRDGWVQLHCELELARPPLFQLEERLRRDHFYAFIERTWMAQHLPLAAALYTIGGMPWLVWGVCARVSVCVTGHWLVGHFAHRRGHQRWVVEGAAAQGYNIPIAGLISMGESYHNNHHAFPSSARLGLHPGEIDLGWLLIRCFEALGLAGNIVTPTILPQRSALRRLPATGERRAA